MTLKETVKKHPQKILVTGASCFVGYHLVSSLHAKGYEVHPTLSKRFELYKSPTKERVKLLKKLDLKFHVIDLTNSENVKILINEIKPDYIFHFAADTKGIKENKFSLEKSTTNNLSFIENLYNSIGEKNNTKIIIASTNAEYTNVEGKVSENSSCQTPFNAYGLSKLRASLRALQIADSKKIKTAVIRIFNPIGPHDADHKLLPQVIKALKEKKSIDLSPCVHKRDFIYIDRLIEGMLKLINLLDNTNKYKIVMNLCYGQPTEIKSLIIKIVECLNANKDNLKFDVLKLRPGEPIVNYGDNSIAKKELNWSPGNIFEDISSWLKKT